MPICRVCNKTFKVISNTHLRQHGSRLGSYAKKFGQEGVGFTRLISDLPKSDPRYIQWRQNLKNRPPPWSKGYTKENHPGVAKISLTFKLRKIDNFSSWRKRAQQMGQIRSEWPAFKKDGDLAEFIGVLLGDGHIAKFPRTECLTLASNSEDKEFIERYAALFKKFFDKNPYIEPKRVNNCTRIRIYQKDISKRLGMPTGNRGKTVNRVPKWISQNRKFLIRYLRGLYEAEGSFCVHKPTSTYKLLFSNKNPTLLEIVHLGLQKLGFHPHRSLYKVQLSRREEVYKCKDLLKFRQY